MNAHRTSVLVGLLMILAGAATAAEPSLELKQKIDLKGKAGNLDHLALDAKRDRLLVANKVNNTLDVVDLKAGKLLRQIPNQQGIQGIAYAADLDRVFVGLGSGGFCNIFDGETYKLQKTIKFADDADNVRYHAASKRVYVAHAEKALGVIDAVKYNLLADIKLPGTAEGFQLEKGRPRLYLAMPVPSEIIVIDTEKNEVINRYPVTMAGGQHPVVLDEAGKRLYIGCRKKPMVVVMDTETGKELAGIDIPGDVDDLFLDAKRQRLYASCGEGAVVVIGPKGDRWEVLEKIETAKGAKTSYFDADTGRFFLAVPRQTGKQGLEVWVYQVKQ